MRLNSLKIVCAILLYTFSLNVAHALSVSVDEEFPEFDVKITTNAQSMTNWNAFTSDADSAYTGSITIEYNGYTLVFDTSSQTFMKIDEQDKLRDLPLTITSPVNGVVSLTPLGGHVPKHRRLLNNSDVTVVLDDHDSPMAKRRTYRITFNQSGFELKLAYRTAATVHSSTRVTITSFWPETIKLVQADDILTLDFKAGKNITDAVASHEIISEDWSAIVQARAHAGSTETNGVSGGGVK